VISVAFSADARDFVKRDWSDLVAQDPSGTIFHGPEFLKLYWEEFGEGTLLLAFGEDGPRQVAAVAFEQLGEQLRFLGGTEITDYLGPVGEPGQVEIFADALWAALADRDWAEADLRGLPEDSPWLAALRRSAEAHGVSVEETDDQNGVAPFLDLPDTASGGWETYLQSIPSKLRHEIRRKAKKLEAETGPYSIEVTTEATLATHLDRFVELHRMSEGPKGVFMVPGMEIFFRRLAEEFLPTGVFRLTFIRVGDELAAGTIGFLAGGTYFLYNSAFDRRWQRLGPGMVLVAEDIRRAIDEGCSRFDLLKGDYGYKYRFGARPRAVRRLVARRR
jgi:CelD/BcsL family acetyltransferase involved in cellulose biosynthesis